MSVRIPYTDTVKSAIKDPNMIECEKIQTNKHTASFMTEQLENKKCDRQQPTTTTTLLILANYHLGWVKICSG